MQILNIALIYPGYPPENDLGGGISTYVQEAARGLSDIGHRVTVISRTKDAATEEEDFGIKIIRVPGDIKLSKLFKFLSFNYFGAVIFSYKIRKILANFEKQNGDFDIVEVGDWGAEGFAIFKKYKDRLIIRCHTPSFVSEKYNLSNRPYLSNFIKLLEKFIIKNVKYIASPSKSLINEIKKYTQIKGKIIIEPYPLRSQHMPCKLAYQKSFVANHPLKIVSVGRLEERKGQDIVCRALNILHQKDLPIETTFIGADTPLNNKETMKIKLTGILSNKARMRVTFAGQIPRREMLQKYTKFDIFITASRFESLGFAILEAMRAGLPVIGPDICEIPRLIGQTGNNTLFTAGNPDDLAKKIMKFIKYPSLIKRVGVYNRKTIIHTYQKNNPLSQMLKTYSNIQKSNIS